ncbi:MAG TPA: methyltransferase domain-containing protein [Burkholderiaceae bacterium]|nr:methyltransferase domain-containing protein [Burkholderiaceae bacterium]
MPPDAPVSTVRALDAMAASRAAQRLARAPVAPWLHGEVARRMAERLPIVRRVPERVLDWWAHAGGGAAQLRAAYPRAQVVAVEAGTAAAGAAAPWWSPRRWRAAPAPLPDGAVPAGAAQLVWANMMLHAARDPAAVMRGWCDALAVDGFLMFSTLGPDTLRSLRALYAEAGWGPPHAPFVDMHDLGDMLVGAGFAAPVMDQELLRLTWASPQALLAELRGLGGNTDPARFAGLRTPRWRARLEAALRARADGAGRIALEFEIVYGHAFRPPPRVPVAAQTLIGVDELRRMARRGGGGGEPLR